MSEIYTPLLLEDIKRTADLCVKCNICTSACPVVPVTDLFPGPKFVGPQAQRFRDPGLPSPDHSLDYCSGCGVCTLVCPHGVKVMEINTAAKAELRTRQFRENPLNLRWWRNTAFGYNEVLGQVGGTVAPLANTVMGFKPVRMLMEKTLGIDHHAPFPTFHFNKFRGWFFGQHQREKGPFRPNAPKVAYFHGCATQHYEMEVGKAIVAVLEHNGFEVRAAGAELLRPADAVQRQLCRSPALRPGESPQAGAIRRTGHPHRRRRDKLRPGAEVRLPGIVGHPHRRGEAGGRARLRHQRIPVAPARSRAAPDRFPTPNRPLHPVSHLLPSRSCTASAGPRSTCWGWCPVWSSRRWASIAAASPAPTATSTRSTILRKRWASRCSTKSWPPAHPWRSATTRRAAGTSRPAQGLDVVHTVEVLADAYGLTWDA